MSYEITIRDTLAEVAITQIGLGEEVSNNSGPYITLIRRGLRVFGGGAWCAAFVSYALEQAFALHGRKLPKGVRSRSARKLFRNLIRKMKATKHRTPRVGDIELMKRRGGKHIGVVVWVSRCGEYWTNVEGNVGRFPAKVKRVQHKGQGNTKSLGFARLPLGNHVR